MIETLAIVISIVLAIIAGLHLYWAFGGLWPGKDEFSLARKVVGSPKVHRMPPRSSTIVVAVLIAAAALWPLMWTGLIASPLPGVIVWLGMYVLALVFLARGAAGYWPAFRARFPEQPFATRDRRYYSPLCIAIGTAFLLLIYLTSL